MNLAAIGSRLRSRFVKVGTAAYDSGNTSTIKLPQGSLFRTLWVRLSGSLNISSGLTNLSESPLGLISKIEFLADGRTIHTNSARHFYRDAHFLTSKAPELVAPTGTGSAVAIAFAFPIFLEAYRRANPADSLFWSDPYGQLEMKITWAAVGSIYSAGTATVNTSTSVTVTLEDTYEGHEQAALIRETRYIDKVVTAAQSDFEIALPKTGILDHLLIEANVDGVTNDALISDVSFEFDGSWNSIRSVPWYDLQNKGINDRSVDGGASGTGRIAGFAFIDLVENGMLTSAPNLRVMTDPKLKLTTTLPSGTTRNIRVTLVTYDVAPGAAATA